LKKDVVKMNKIILGSLDAVKKETGIEDLKIIMTLNDLNNLDVTPNLTIKDYIEELEEYGYRFVLIKP